MTGRPESRRSASDIAASKAFKQQLDKVYLWYTGCFLLFVVALGFWLGLCVGVMSLVRHFYATAAVVAGCSSSDGEPGDAATEASDTSGTGNSTPGTAAADTTAALALGSFFFRPRLVGGPKGGPPSSAGSGADFVPLFDIFTREAMEK